MTAECVRPDVRGFPNRPCESFAPYASSSSVEPRLAVGIRGSTQYGAGIQTRYGLGGYRIDRPARRGTPGRARPGTSWTRGAGCGEIAGLGCRSAFVSPAGRRGPFFDGLVSTPRATSMPRRRLRVRPLLDARDRRPARAAARCRGSARGQRHSARPWQRSRRQHQGLSGDRASCACHAEAEPAKMADSKTTRTVTVPRAVSSHSQACGDCHSSRHHAWTLSHGSVPSLGGQ